MMNVNRKVGNGFEKDLCRILAAYGFWTHRMTQNSQGQPFDVIAARNGACHPIDCKVCAKDIFKLNRVEENQASAMFRWRETGNGESWFALQMSNGEIFFISFSKIERMCLMKTVLSASEIKALGVPIKEWVSRCK